MKDKKDKGDDGFLDKVKDFIHDVRAKMFLGFIVPPLI